MPVKTCDLAVSTSTCPSGVTLRKWRAPAVALLMVAGLASCARTSPQPEIAAGQRRCVIYHPYYYNGDKRPGEREIRTALSVQVGGGEKYTLRPYRSLHVPVPRSGTVVAVMDDPMERWLIPRRSETATIPAGGEDVYVRVGRSEGQLGMAVVPNLGAPVPTAGYVMDRATLVKPEVARKELAEFE